MPARQRIVIVGAAGQARDTAWLLREVSQAGVPVAFVGFVVSDLSKLTDRDSRVQILGDFSWLHEHSGDVDAVVLGIGSPAVRLALADELSRAHPSLEWPALVHPSALFDRTSTHLGRGAMIAAGVVGSVNLQVDDFSLVNIGVTLGHETHVGPGAVVNHAASISGGVEIGRGVLVGTGARVLQYLTIGEGATVGAGAVVTKDVEPGVTVVGVPARKQLAVGQP